VRLRPVAALAALACFAACAGRQALVVVFPDAGGRAGAVTLQDGKRALVLDKPFAAGEVRSGAARPAEVEPEQARQIFAAALAAQPIVPSQFTLYFETNTDQLTPDSKQRYREVLADVQRRPVPEVEAIGCTDTVGTQQDNQRLSLQRAAAVRTMLLRDGVAAAISVAGRGKLDPAVKTADQVDEPRNRRVVITVR
jgi:OmpA-OmpF porin, OOP family